MVVFVLVGEIVCEICCMKHFITSVKHGQVRLPVAYDTREPTTKKWKIQKN